MDLIVDINAFRFFVSSNLSSPYKKQNNCIVMTTNRRKANGNIFQVIRKGGSV